MRVKILVYFLFFTALMGCKDKEASPESISGEYKIVEVEIYQPPATHPFPTPDGEHGKVVLTTNNDKDATVRLLLYDKNEKVELDESFDCIYGKDEDGDFFFKEEGSGRTIAYTFDKEMDFYGIPGARFSATK